MPIVIHEVLTHRKEGTIVLRRENDESDKVLFIENRKPIATIPLATALTLHADLLALGWRMS